MPEHSQITYSRHSASALFKLVADVESYPQFLPWCVGSRVKRITDNEMLAELLIGFKSFRESYTSRVILYPVTEGVGRITSTLEKGSFKHLYSEWIFTQLSDGRTEISFEVSFEFKNKILDALIGGVFSRAVMKMSEAFEKRANDILS